MQAKNQSSQNSTPRRWIEVLDADRLVDSSAVEVVAEGRLIAVFRSDQALYAVDALCAHHGGPLSEGHVADGCVTCPWHGWQYRLCDGTQLSSGEPLIEAYPIRECGGKIEVAIAPMK
jgi:nitrite reductase/ring-hydroxylating ferredoxin subunit